MRVLFILLLLFCLPSPVFAGSSTLADAVKPEKGGGLANFTLPVPTDQQKAAYLGLDPQARSFNLNDIEAKVLLVEIFSMYCPFCQREAPAVNEMYEKLLASDLAGELKMFGIGTGNSEYEVDVFRQKFSVQMPLFADPDFEVYNTIGQVGTPFFMLLQTQPGTDSLKILDVHEGILSEPQVYLKEMLDHARGLPASP